MLVINALKEICIRCGDNQHLTIKASAPEALQIKDLMKILAQGLVRQLQLDLNKYTVHISSGFGYFPKVPWIGITYKKQRVSQNISICLCFSKTGEGFVAGAMNPYPITSGKKTTIDRNQSEDKFISLIGGDRRTTNYDDKFFNPKDFYKNKIVLKELVEHLKDSFKYL